MRFRSFDNLVDLKFCKMICCNSRKSAYVALSYLSLNKKLMHFVFVYRYLVTQGCIKPLCDLLTCPDPRIVTVSLEGLENILKVGEQEKDLGNSNGINVYARYIDEAEGLEKIENLQTHDNNEIYEKAVKILETYWLEEDEDQNHAPAGDATQSNFTFGGTQPVAYGDFNFG